MIGSFPCGSGDRKRGGAGGGEHSLSDFLFFWNSLLNRRCRERGRDAVEDGPQVTRRPRLLATWRFAQRVHQGHRGQSIARAVAIRTVQQVLDGKDRERPLQLLPFSLAVALFLRHQPPIPVAIRQAILVAQLQADGFRRIPAPRYGRHPFTLLR